MPASIAYHTRLAAGAGWCCKGPTLTARRHDVADQTRGRRAPDESGTDRPSDLGVPLRRRGGDADEPPQGTPGIGIASDDSPRGHRHPRWCSTPFDVGAVEELAAGALRPALIALLSRASVLELNVARLQRRLPGDTPEARFTAFFTKLATPERSTTTIAWGSAMRAARA